jgi:hypothetical protein
VLHRTPLAELLLLFAFLCAAGPAMAAADLESVTVGISTVREAGAVKRVVARIEVTGERIVSAAITPPGATTAVPLTAAAGGFFLEQSFATEAELAAAFPEGTAVLTLNGTQDVEIEVVRVPVTSPAITVPIDADILEPGPVEVEFARCSICDQEGDSTTGLLLVDAAVLAEPMSSATLGPVGVVNTSGLPATDPFEVQIGSERLVASRLDDTHVTVLERGVGGTTPAAHAANAVIALVLASDDTLGPRGSVTALADAMTESTLGPVEVEDALKLPAGHALVVQIGSERLLVERLDETHITVLERGVDGTAAAAHATNDRVTEVGQSDTLWTPAAELGEDGSFTAAIVHTAVRVLDQLGPGNDAFVLAGVFTSEDSVSFFTGAGAPAGEICVVVDDESLDTGSCFVVDHPEEESGALLDPRDEEVPLPIGGVDVEYTSEVLPSGEITGTARADLDGNGSLESETPVTGRMTGFAGKVERNLGFKFSTSAPAAKLSVKIEESGFVTEGSLNGKQTAKGTVQGVKIKDSAPSTLPLGEPPLGWRLKVTLADKHITTASVTLSDGREIALTGKLVFDFLTGLAKLDLKSSGDDAGVSVRIEELEIDDSADPPRMVDGVLIYKILGQRGRFPRAR